MYLLVYNVLDLLCIIRHHLRIVGCHRLADAVVAVNALSCCSRNSLFTESAGRLLIPSMSLVLHDSLTSLSGTSTDFSAIIELIRAFRSLISLKVHCLLADKLRHLSNNSVLLRVENGVRESAATRSLSAELAARDLALRSVPR